MSKDFFNPVLGSAFIGGLITYMAGLFLLILLLVDSAGLADIRRGIFWTITIVLALIQPFISFFTLKALGRQAGVGGLVSAVLMLVLADFFGIIKGGSFIQTLSPYARILPLYWGMLIVALAHAGGGLLRAMISRPVKS